MICYSINTAFSEIYLLNLKVVNEIQSETPIIFNKEPRKINDKRITRHNIIIIIIIIIIITHYVQAKKNCLQISRIKNRLPCNDWLLSIKENF